MIALVTAGTVGLGMYRDQMIRASEMQPVAFEHGDHSGESCVECHHDYIDGIGAGMCYFCHKHDQKIAVQMEDMFHDFCRGCHVERTLAGEKAGPVRVCVDCHRRAGSPE